jgi:hypothetical protein
MVSVLQKGYQQVLKKGAYFRRQTNKANQTKIGFSGLQLIGYWVTVSQSILVGVIAVGLIRRKNNEHSYS